MLGHYLEDVARGDNIKNLVSLSDGTICNYLRSAAAYIEHVCPGTSIPLFASATGSQKVAKLHPYLGELLGQRRIWKQPRARKEPVSAAMIDAMASMADAYLSSGRYGNYGRDPVLFDWSCLAGFTGSRIGEYGVGKKYKGMPIDGWISAPTSHDVPEEWRGKPLAFMADDFTLFNKHLRRVEHSEARRHPRRVEYVDVRFRYDKSTDNFVIRRFQRLGGAFCLIRAVLSILQRQHEDPRQRQGEPLGFFVAENGRRSAITSRHMKVYLQQACRRAHPDPDHYLRLHIDSLMAHSFRVMAAVALHNAGVPVEDIAWRLRWKTDSVKIYLRDCARTVEQLTFKAMAGAYVHALC